jgi:isoquinoline 1-oxidoreductase beta subunit
MTDIVNVSRRRLLKGIAVSSSLILAFPYGLATAEPAQDAPFAPSAYLAIDESGLVTIVGHRSEMGTGIKTDLALVVADELEADWSRVRVVAAQGDARYGDQNTDGSRSTWQFFQKMRETGAAARQMLEAGAALTWHLPASECRAQNGSVVHVPSGRSLPFGELVRFAATQPVPESGELRLKNPKAWRYIGRSMPIVDLKDIVRGKAVYGLDVVVPGMKHAAIERCPVYGGKIRSFDATEALKVAGVARVVEIPATPPPSGFKPLGGIAVIASSTWAAEQGRARLKVEWDEGPNAAHDSKTYRAELEATAREPGRVLRHEGNVHSALASASHHVVGEYFVPYLAHTPMEVPNAVAHWHGGTCEVWCPTQNPQGARTTVAQVLGVPETDVTLNVTLLGGAFGRKSKPDFAAEAALLSRAVGSPIKVTWTREDDIRHDYYHAICAQRLEAGIDHDGRVTAWLHRTVFPPIPSTFQADVVYGDSGHLQQGVTDVPYDIASIRCENGPAPNHVRIGWYRSVYNIPHAFAACSFVDEIAVAAGKDPVDNLRQLFGPPRTIDLKARGIDYPNYGVEDLLPTMRRAYLVDTGRLRSVLDLVAAQSGWGGKLPAREGRGIAVHRSFLTYAAAVAHVAVGRDGQVTIRRIDLAVDCGIVVNPDRVRAQMEGAAIMGISNALYSAISFSKGRTEQSNFTDYLVARIDTAPETHVHLVESSAAPSGAGEPGVPPIAPAICNAIYAAVGKRLRALPVDPDALKAS